MIHKAYSRTPKKRVSNLLLLATVFCTPAGSTSPYASIHALQLAIDSDPSSCKVPGNPAGAATAGGVIGDTRTSVKRCAETLKDLASVMIILRSIPSKRASMPFKQASMPFKQASMPFKRAFSGSKAFAIAPANHAGATSCPAKLWMTLTKLKFQIKQIIL